MRVDHRYHGARRIIFGRRLEGLLPHRNRIPRGRGLLGAKFWGKDVNGEG